MNLLDNETVPFKQNPCSQRIPACRLILGGYQGMILILLCDNGTQGWASFLFSERSIPNSLEVVKQDCQTVNICDAGRSLCVSQLGCFWWFLWWLLRVIGSKTIIYYPDSSYLISIKDTSLPGLSFTPPRQLLFTPQDPGSFPRSLQSRTPDFPCPPSTPHSSLWCNLYYMTVYLQMNACAPPIL